MFNSYHTHVARGPGHVSVTRSGHLPDESVRILRELEEAAEKRVLERGASPDNDLHYTWTIMQNYAEDNLTLCTRFSLNGRDHTFKTSWCPVNSATPREKFKLIRDQVAEEIASQVVQGLLTPNNLQTLTSQP